MPRKTLRLTARLIDDICTRLKAGSFDVVAVQSAGVPWQVYQNWLKRASEAGCPAIYCQLVDAVNQARAQARLRAEMEVREKDAKAWLLYGPGRATATQDGWGAASRSATTQSEDTSARLFELCSLILKALLPFPDARAAAAEALAVWQNQPPAQKAKQGQQ